MTYIIVALIFGAIGAVIGSGKGRGGLGFVLGALLALIGVIIIAVMDPSPEHAVAQGPREPAGLPLEARLRQLDTLRASGTLTDAEHAAERARLLTSI